MVKRAIYAERPWLKEYKIYGIPETLEPFPDAPVFDLLDSAAKKHRKMGCVQLGKEMKYPEIKEHADRLATAFADLGVRKGDKVATMLPTSIQFVIVDYAISKAGAVHIPCSFLEPVYNLEHKFRDGRPKVIACTDEHYDTVEVLKKNFGIEKIILTKLEDYSSTPPEHRKIEDIWLTDLIWQYTANPPEVKINVEEDLETLLFTGGTTGLPKGCMLTHRNIMANALQNSAVFGPLSKVLCGNMAVLLGLPFFHVYGHSIMHTMTYNGFLQLLVADARDTECMVKMIKEYYPIMQIGVPTQYMKMLKEELKGFGMLGISGSAALPPEIQEEFERKSSGMIIEGYGLSELSPVTHMNLSAFFRLFGGRRILRLLNGFLRLPLVIPTTRLLIKALGTRNLGRLFTRFVSLLTRATRRARHLRGQEKRATIGIPFPDTDVKVVDVDSGRRLSWDEMSEGKTGEMCLKGPQRMLGYWPTPGKGLDEEEYVHTGDVVKVDGRGYFYIVDRTKDMINISGFKVYSRELDDILYEHPAVEFAAAIGVPDPERPGSERVKVYIQIKPEYRGKVKAEEFIDYLSGKVAKYAVPKYCEFIDDMPLTEVQKVDKKALRARD